MAGTPNKNKNLFYLPKYYYIKIWQVRQKKNSVFTAKILLYKNLAVNTNKKNIFKYFLIGLK